MRVAIIFGLILGFSEIIYAQDNLSFDYEIVKTTETAESGRFQIHIPVHRVILYVDSHKLQEYQNYSKQRWFDLILKEEACHKACLVLYAVYEKDAEIFLDIDENAWFATRRDKELAYWSKVLKD